ncbi:MAG: response regulator transcription factor [Gallionellaceae bacterium]|nr:response regulator transcription factor [Gallionellaceae bacterium]
MIRILIVDDHAIVRQGLRRIVEDEKQMHVGGEAANGDEALKMLRTGKWDVILLDISMPGKNGIDTMKRILERHADAKVLILSMYPEDQYAVRLMKAGASGYLTKESAPEMLIQAIRSVVAGKKHISPNLAELLLAECGIESGKSPHELLSDREYQVLRLIGSGKKVSEIAEMLSLSVKTVSTYRSHILDKMKLKNSAELTYYVIQNGLSD